MAEFNEPKMHDVPDDSEEFELGHTDKLVGVFTAPTETFTKIGNFPPKVIDWFLPMFIVILVAVFAGFVKMSNPTINVEEVQKQREAIAKSFEGLVKENKMTQDDADKKVESYLEFTNGPIGKAIGVVGGLVGGFVVFFIIAGFFHLLARFVLGGNGTYSYALVSYGLAAYISILQHIIATIASLLTSKLITSISLATIFGFSKTSILGFLLSFIDPISIWFYLVLGIALAKTYKSNDTKKFIIVIFAIWIGISLLLYVLASFVPFLKPFVGL